MTYATSSACRSHPKRSVPRFSFKAASRHAAVQFDGFWFLPSSNLEITDCSTPDAASNSSCVRPRIFRASRSVICFTSHTVCPRL